MVSKIVVLYSDPGRTESSGNVAVKFGDSGLNVTCKKSHGAEHESVSMVFTMTGSQSGRVVTTNGPIRSSW